MRLLGKDYANSLPPRVAIGAYSRLVGVEHQFFKRTAEYAFKEVVAVGNVIVLKAARDADALQGTATLEDEAVHAIDAAGQDNRLQRRAVAEQVARQHVVGLDVAPVNVHA